MIYCFELLIHTHNVWSLGTISHCIKVHNPHCQMFPNLTTSPGVSTSPVKPQLKDLVLVQTTKWYNLGLQLGIEDTELDVIEENNPKDIDACKRKMFKTWLKITPIPSYQQLVEALQTVGEIKEADHLSKKYGKTWLYWKLKCLDIRLSSTDNLSF